MKLTRFPDRFAKSKEDFEMSWDEFVGAIEAPYAVEDKHDCHYIKMAAFNDTPSENNCLRYDANVTEVTGIEGDHDAGTMSPEKAAELLESAGVEALIYTSASHTPESPRWRLLARFSEPFAGPTDEMRKFRTAQLAKIDNVLGGVFANESYTLSQGFLYGKVVDRDYQVIKVEGDLVDQRDDLNPRRPGRKTADDGGQEHVEPFNGERLNWRDMLNDLYDEDNYHQSQIRIASSMVAQGVPGAVAKKMLQSIFYGMPEKGEKWQNRFDYIDTAVDTAMEKFNPPIPINAKPIGESTLAEEPPPPQQTVFGLVPRAPWALVGAGGTMKTTLALRMGIEVVTGRDVFGIGEVAQQGPVVFLSREDEEEQLRWRLYHIAKEMGLSVAEKRMVADEVFLEDLTGTTGRLVESTKDGNLEFGPLVNQLLELYQGIDPALMLFDPAVYFGPGERFVNDGEALLMNAGRALCKGLNCSVGFLHHTGKAAARSGDVDQYAGRGGSAFADNSRGLMVATDKKGREPLPDGITTTDLEAGRAIRLEHVKYSYGRRFSAPIWVLRGAVNPWRFDIILGADKGTQEESAQVIAARENIALTQMQKIHVAIEFMVKVDNRYPTKSGIRNELARELGIGKTAVTALIDEMINKGSLESMPLPEGHPMRVGARTSYLVPGKIPHGGWPKEPLEEEPNPFSEDLPIPAAVTP